MCPGYYAQEIFNEFNEFLRILRESLRKGLKRGAKEREPEDRA